MQNINITLYLSNQSAQFYIYSKSLILKIYMKANHFAKSLLEKPGHLFEEINMGLNSWKHYWYGTMRLKKKHVQKFSAFPLILNYF